MTRKILKILLIALPILVFGCSDAGDPPTAPPDSPVPPSVSVNNQAVIEGTPVGFTVSLSKASDSLVTFQYSTADSTASAPADYLAVLSATDTIPVGSTSVAVTIPTVDDSTPEATESFKLTLGNLTGGTFTDSIGLGTILDNDESITVSIGDAAVTEGTPAGFTISLNQASGNDVTFQYSTADSTAVAPSDFLSVTLTQATIPAGSTGITLNIVTVDDAVFELTENFKLILSNLTGATFTDSVGLGTILDNDQGVAVSISDPVVVEGSQASFVISLSATSGNDVTFSFATEDGTATSSADYIAVPLTGGSIAAGLTSGIVTVQTVDNSSFEQIETFRLVLSILSGATFADSIGVGTIIDNDAVSYVNDVKPILLGSCAIATCHGGSTGRSGLAMENAEYSTMITATGDVTTILNGTGLVIIPGSASQSNLYRKTLNTTDPLFPFGSRMPFAGPELSPIQKAKIRDWIDQGAQNN
jgi:hypothetical protein